MCSSSVENGMYWPNIAPTRNSGEFHKVRIYSEKNRYTFHLPAMWIDRVVDGSVCAIGSLSLPLFLFHHTRCMRARSPWILLFSFTKFCFSCVLLQHNWIFPRRMVHVCMHSTHSYVLYYIVWTIYVMIWMVCESKRAHQHCVRA